ncbi:Cu(I)/Ag(I) efflux system membrane protein CusA/SilA [Psychroflexus salarius]|uniref:Cu(I)/Ag(I) efflux system membrane protein CusA/SilA n=1 Tax=Psychroflexus salarius TaxID=1155689 RepID=A0A1M4VS16_9FLAO|nr:efflux RND transporter permease subunit [Psychroflexus salarius]SHE71921.1 Cu(I)/Ag(I) efflux system membrane protein CusA/SilA [Psychroflexus salarius]
MLNKIIQFFLNQRLVSFILLSAIIISGLIVSPFQWADSFLPKNPIPVDAIPNTGANQQIVFTEWPGRSPQDIDDQITYPLTTYLLGLPGVESVRSNSMFGFSSIYIIFDDDVAFYWSRSRILEKLSSIPQGLLPAEAKPTLGPDATALGQVFWYTLEPRDKNNNPTGGWNLDEIRSVQDFYVKYGLSSAKGISEVASIGGFVKEYQIDVNPDALKSYGISLMQVAKAVKESNRDVGAKTLEINQVEYIVRGLGYINNLQDFESIVVDENQNVPIYLKDVAQIKTGPAQRRGVLDKAGAEVVGGVVIARDGFNPMEAINHVKDKIKEISPGLPSKTLADGTKSQLKIISFYDRSELINETINTLEDAISLQLIIALLVVIIIVFNLRASLVISAVLPISVLLVFIAMKWFNVQANIVALSGIAIAIGTMIDLAIILSENVLKKLEESPKNSLVNNIYKGSAEVSSAILTAVLTTVVSFIPVFALEAAEGKLFMPLAYTKTFALIAAFLVTVLILPSLMHIVFKIKINKTKISYVLNALLFVIGVWTIFNAFWLGLFVLLYAVSYGLSHQYFNKRFRIKNLHFYALIAGVLVLLSKLWLPLGAQQSMGSNIIFVGLLVGVLLAFYLILQKYYAQLLTFFLKHIKGFLLLPLLSILIGIMIWLGFSKVFYYPKQASNALGFSIENTRFWNTMNDLFPGIGKEFMPSLNEGSFILMPTSMTHSGIEFNKDKLQQMDVLVSQIPEIKTVVGKLGRVESAIDPAPISMFENLITYKSEFILNEDNSLQAFEVNAKGWFKIQGLKIEEHQVYLTKQSNDVLWFDNQNYVFANKNGMVFSDDIQSEIFYEIENDFAPYLIEDSNGNYFRNWRQHIQSTDDIWNEIVKVTKIPGLTSAPKLQPIETRQVMLQTGMRAPMGIKVSGPDLKTIEDFGQQLEPILKQVDAIKSQAVFADRVVAKPYLHINLNREKLARYGLSINDVQNYIAVAIGGEVLTQTVEGRERYDVRVRYPRELRNTPQAIQNMLISTSSNTQIPLGELVDIEYEPGPQMIKREETFLNSYVLFDRADGVAEVTAVEAARDAIASEIKSGNLKVPSGVSYRFAGNFENQVRSEKRLSIIIPVVFVIIFLVLYFQFKSVRISLMVFSSVALAFSGGFIMIWFYGQDWFLNFSWFGENLRDIFQLKTINLSVAVWVGFIALFGIATDDAVLMATYLRQSFKANPTKTKKELREAVMEGGLKRIRPAVMTSVTTVIALLPVLSSTGKGSNIMVPMAIPAFGGMLMASLTYFLLPILFYVIYSRQLNQSSDMKFK